VISLADLDDCDLLTAGFRQFHVILDFGCGIAASAPPAAGAAAMATGAAAEMP
jgi:hypothetical protein